MKKSIDYIVWLLCLTLVFAACDENEPDLFDKSANGAYFDYEYGADFNKQINFCDHIVGNPDTVSVALKVKLLGYLETENRTLSVKTKEVEGYMLAQVAIEKAEAIAKAITDALGGYGIFGVELFIQGEDVIFSEVSPRPHDTGMVTMISQDMSEFALHARAVLGLPVPEVKFYGPSASKAIVVEGNTREYEFCNLEKVLEEPGVQIRFFGKPEISGHRRVGVILATDESTVAALAKAERAYAKLKVLVK